MKLLKLVTATVAVLAGSSLAADQIVLDASALQQAKASLFNTLGLVNQQIYDKAGKIREDVFSTWSDSQLKEWADIHGLAVPQTSTRDELTAYYRRNRHLLQQDIEEYLKQASSTVLPYIGRATDAAAQGASHVRDNFFKLWSDSRLKAFVEARTGQAQDAAEASRDKLVELAEAQRKLLSKHLSSAFDFSAWSTDKLKVWLEERKLDVAGTQDQLVARAQKFVDSTNIKTWSDRDLHSFLTAVGVDNVPEKHDELVAKAQGYRNWFKYNLYTQHTSLAVAYYYAHAVWLHVGLLASKVNGFVRGLVSDKTDL